MKKFLILLIFAVLLGGNAMAYSFSAVCSSGQTLYYTVQYPSSTYQVAVVSQNTSSPYYSTYPTGNLIIPSSVTYNGTTYSVTGISAEAFYGCSGLTSVTIPNSVTGFGVYAFSDCTGLTSITIPESVTSIGESAFQRCGGLTTVNFNATNCISGSFGGCASLTSLNIGENVTNIPEYAFYDCSGLTEVTIPNSVTSIGNYAFRNCSGLTSVTIGNSVESIGVDAFSGCSGLTTVNFNATNCTTMGSHLGHYYYPVFSNCNANATINIGNNVTTIPDYAFYGILGSGNLTIPNSVTSIGNSAFLLCSGLTSVTIPNSVTSIGQYAFCQCSGLTGELIIPNSVTSIGQDAFSSCSGLTSVTIPNSVTSIGQSAFSLCSGLTGELIIPNSVTSIGDGTFYGCSGLTSVTIPNSVTSIGSDAFYECSGLTSVYYTGDVAGWCRIEFGGLYANPVSYALNLYINNELVTNLTIPETISEIKAYAFIGDTCLTSVTIPNSVTSIGAGAFSGCIGLTGELTIPNSVTSIGDGTFYGCSGLTSVTIPNSVTSIGSDAFYECSGLTSVYYTGDVAGWCRIEFGGLYANPVSYALNLYINNELVTNLTIPETISEIKAYAFIGDTCLTSVTIPNSVTSIGAGAFSGCIGLTGELTIPNSVTSIGSMAFNACRGLTSVTIGNGVTSIGQRAFSYCNSLYKVYSNAENPPSIESWTFESGLLFFVPCGAENNYLADEQWGRLNINSELPHSVTLNSNDEAMGTAVLLHQYCGSSTAVVEARPRYGYHFVHWNDGNTDNPRTINVTQDVTYTATFEVGDGIEENNVESKISIFPNPATDILNITSPETISSIEIVNALGQVVMQMDVNDDNAVCDVEELPNGFYVVRIYNEDTKSFCQKKFAKE